MFSVRFQVMDSRFLAALLCFVASPDSRWTSPSLRSPAIHHLNSSWCTFFRCLLMFWCSLLLPFTASSGLQIPIAVSWIRSHLACLALAFGCCRIHLASGEDELRFHSLILPPQLRSSLITSSYGLCLFTRCWVTCTIRLRAHMRRLRIDLRYSRSRSLEEYENKATTASKLLFFHYCRP